MALKKYNGNHNVAVFKELNGAFLCNAGNPCSDVNNPATAIAISAISPGNLIKQVDQTALPPALPPSPVLDNEDVVDPPLPPVTKIKNNAAPAQAPKASGATKRVGNFGIVSTVITLFFGMVCFF